MPTKHDGRAIDKIVAYQRLPERTLKGKEFNIKYKLPTYSYIEPYFKWLKQRQLTGLQVLSGITQFEEYSMIRSTGIFASIFFDLIEDVIYFETFAQVQAGTEVNSYPDLDQNLGLNTLNGQELSFSFKEDTEKNFDVSINYGKYGFNRNPPLDELRNLPDNTWMNYLIGSQCLIQEAPTSDSPDPSSKDPSILQSQNATHTLFTCTGASISDNPSSPSASSPSLPTSSSSLSAWTLQDGKGLLKYEATEDNNFKLLCRGDTSCYQECAQ